jgi:hypothetical protein
MLDNCAAPFEYNFCVEWLVERKLKACHSATLSKKSHMAWAGIKPFTVTMESQ